MKKRIYSTTLSVILVLFILLSLTIFILNKNIEGYPIARKSIARNSIASKSAKDVNARGLSLPTAKLTLHSNLNQKADNKK